MDDREKQALASIGQQGRQLRANLEKARAQMEQSGTVRDKRIFEDAYRKWKSHAESWRKVIDHSIGKGARPWSTKGTKDLATKTESTAKKDGRG